MADAIPPRRPPPPLLDDACALFLDVDGTLLEFEIHPDLVGLPLGALDIIGRVSDRLGGALALVSGRPLAELDSLFSPQQFPAAGLHGQQFRGVVAPQPVRSGDALSALRQEATRFAERHPGVLVEDKGANLALHWRTAPACRRCVDATGRIAPAAVARLPAAARRPCDRTGACRRRQGSRAAYADGRGAVPGRMPVFIGDDLTDEFGFAAAHAAGGWSVQVGAREPTQAQYRLADPTAVHAWLRRNAVPAASPQGNP